RYLTVTGVQTCALPISWHWHRPFLELAGSRIEHADAIATEFAEPEAVLGVHHAATRRRAGSGDCQKRDLAAVAVDASDVLLTKRSEERRVGKEARGEMW